MTLESSDWCIPSSASNLPTWDTMQDCIFVKYNGDYTSGTIEDESSVEAVATYKATTDHINMEYGTEFADVRTDGTPTTLVDLTSEKIKIYEYVDAQHIAVTSDNSWVEGKAYYIKAQRTK